MGLQWFKSAMGTVAGIIHLYFVYACTYRGSVSRTFVELYDNKSAQSQCRTGSSMGRPSILSNGLVEVNYHPFEDVIL